MGAFVDEEAESGCDETDTQECSLAGGTVVEASSCEPNPCAAVPSSVVTVCCVPDEHEAECEVVTPEHCMAAGGGALAGATSCAENPCGQDGSGEGGGPDGSDGVGSED